MGQSKVDRSTQYVLELAEKRLTETTTELLRRDKENAAAVKRFAGEEKADESDTTPKENKG